VEGEPGEETSIPVKDTDVDDTDAQGTVVEDTDLEVTDDEDWDPSLLPQEVFLPPRTEPGEMIQEEIVLPPHQIPLLSESAAEVNEHKRHTMVRANPNMRRRYRVSRLLKMRFGKFVDGRQMPTIMEEEELICDF
jgi:hypothetical protein